MLRSLALVLALLAATPASAFVGPDSWDFLWWAETNWLATAMVSDSPRAWHGKWSEPTVLYLPPGNASPAPPMEPAAPPVNATPQERFNFWAERAKHRPLGNWELIDQQNAA